VIRHPDRRPDHEVEPALLIGKRISRARRSQALESVAGYCIGLDMVTRGPEERISGNPATPTAFVGLDWSQRTKSKMRSFITICGLAV
jgi:2-keto-4-pentenoate hydratase/2-oxohepta-3-ene-1,7-dioic acid hydratase in catechol pathway